MPHFHVLVDASFIPFDKVCEAWNRFRPIEAGPAPTGPHARPGFGSVRFTAAQHKFESIRHAANYATVYLIKHPKHGYPEGVMKSRPGEQIHRYSVSRGFWKVEGLEEDPASPDPASGSEKEVSDTFDEDDAHDALGRTIAERVARCGMTSVLLKVTVIVDLDTGETSQARQFVASSHLSVTDLAFQMCRRIEPGERVIQVTWDEWLVACGPPSECV